MNTSITIGILGADFQTGNLGVNALAAGTLQCLLLRFPGANVFLLNYGKFPSVSTLCIEGKVVKVPLVNIRFSKKLYLPNNIAILFLLLLIRKVVPWRDVRGKLVASNACLQEIEKTDVFVSVAGGDSFSDIYGFGRLLYVALPQILVLLSGKRLIHVPQTYGPFRTRVAKVIARFILARSEMIYSRDFAGQDEIRKLIGSQYDPEKTKFCYDVGFAVVPRMPQNLSIVDSTFQEALDRPMVGVNISGLLLAGGYTGRNMFGLAVDYEKLIRSVVELLIEKKQAKVLLVAHVLSDGESDVEACERVYESLKHKYRDRIGIVRGCYDQSEIKHVIGRCEFFIGSRMHACIAALSQSVPAISIAYSDKFTGVMESIAVSSLVMDARTMIHEEIVDSIDRAYEERHELRRQLEGKMPDVRGALSTMFQFLEV